jgi:antitoxin YefM
LRNQPGNQFSLDISIKYPYIITVHVKEELMPIQTTYTHARSKLAALLDEVTENQEVVIITRRGAQDVAMISAAELSSLTETAHLLRSPKNAERLLTALNRALAGTGTPQKTEELRREVGSPDES